MFLRPYFWAVSFEGVAGLLGETVHFPPHPPRRRPLPPSLLFFVYVFLLIIIYPPSSSFFLLHVPALFTLSLLFIRFLLPTPRILLLLTHPLSFPYFVCFPSAILLQPILRYDVNVLLLCSPFSSFVHQTSLFLPIFLVSNLSFQSSPTSTVPCHILH